MDLHLFKLLAKLFLFVFELLLEVADVHLVHHDVVLDGLLLNFGKLLEFVGLGAQHLLLFQFALLLFKECVGALGLIKLHLQTCNLVLQSWNLATLFFQLLDVC